MSKYKFLQQSLIELILALSHYDSRISINEFMISSGFSDHTFYENLRLLDSNGWITILRASEGRTGTIIIKDQIILAVNLFKTIGKLWDTDVPTAAKAFDAKKFKDIINRIDRDFKEVCKDGVEK